MGYRGLAAIRCSTSGGSDGRPILALLDPAGYLTRAQAEARLAAILAGDDTQVNIAPSHVTFAQACDERLRYLRDDRQRKRSTLRDYENAIRHDLLPYFGAETAVEDITTLDVEAFKDAMLARVSHRTAQKVLVVLHGILARAQRKGWIRSTRRSTPRR